MNKKLLKILLYTSITFFVTSCSVKITADVDKSSLVTLSLVADEGMNPNILGVGAPLEIKVFELADDSMFMSADFEQISNDYEDVLKSTYIKSYDYVLTPGQFKFVTEIEVNDETNYIAVIAYFSQPDLSEWKRSVKIVKKGRTYHMLVQFKGYDINLMKVE